MRKLWVLGEAVQDVTVEIDIELLLRENASLRDSILLNEALWIKTGLWLTTQAGLHSFAVQMQVQNPKSSDGDLAGLLPGDKYNLVGGVLEPPPDLDGDSPEISVRCEDVSWGGGGLNVVRYIRALAPLQHLVPIVYSDIAMNSPLDEKVRDELESGDSTVAHVLANHSADRYLEVYLDSMSVEPVLYRPTRPEFRRNLVISRVRTSNRETDNKIVCRGSSSPDTSGAEQSVLSLLNGRAGEIGAILVDSIKSKELFNAAYGLCKANPSVLAIFALTESMQAVATPLIEDLKKGESLPNCILIFNETEAHRFANRFGPSLKPFMTKAEDIPNLKLFAETATAILQECPFNRLPRIYVTLGPRGSIGVDHQAQVVFLSTFTKQKATIFDTNTCGDAFCGAIALLEWAKLHSAGLQRLAPEGAASWDEMRHFMAVATAAAYSRATSRLGHVDGREVEDLLRHSYLASEVLGHVEELRGGKSRFCDKDGFLIQPLTASAVGIEPGLAQLMSTGRARSRIAAVGSF